MRGRRTGRVERWVLEIESGGRWWRVGAYATLAEAEAARDQHVGNCYKRILLVSLIAE